MFPCMKKGTRLACRGHGIQLSVSVRGCKGSLDGPALTPCIKHGEQLTDIDQAISIEIHLTTLVPVTENQQQILNVDQPVWREISRAAGLPDQVAEHCGEESGAFFPQRVNPCGVEQGAGDWCLDEIGLEAPEVEVIEPVLLEPVDAFLPPVKEQ